ncbi:patatin-like phospholipase family protein [Reyranella massiliensis]|uniref:patatin-like phospholipase family protein n=1 Tax=Reyranella massiliensis TaxID=445220 RepID=UPI0002DBA579|nr:patatin-like phospholipase family protein [Reyranella massiliensis]
MSVGRIAIVAMALMLVGCGSPRPESLQGEVCKSIATAGHSPYPWPDIYQSVIDAQAQLPPVPPGGGPVAAAPAPPPPPPPATPRTAAFRDKIAAQADARQRALAPAPPPMVAPRLTAPPPPPPTRILSVSAGGAWGAFSAGFLEGWGENGAEPRPKFDVVTGVSTGSMVAPVIFLGDAKRMAKLREMYSNLSNKDVFTSRGALSLLTATSLYDNAPLRRKVEEILDEEMVEAIAAENATRTLAVMATNLDSGVPEVFDLTAIAARQDMTMAQKRQRMVAAIMASAALPIGFPPEFIDNNLYVDGGVRLHVFFTRELQAALQGRRLDVTIVVSGDMKVGRDCTGKDGLDLLSIAGRTASIAIDQLLRSSVESLLTVGRQRGNVARYIDAASLIDYGAKVPQPGMPPPGPCRIGGGGGNDDMFDPVFQRCLAAQGAAMGRSAPIPWRLTVDSGRVARPIVVPPAPVTPTSG